MVGEEKADQEEMVGRRRKMGLTVCRALGEPGEGDQVGGGARKAGLQRRCVSSLCTARSCAGH